MSMNAATPLPAQPQPRPGTPSPAPAGKPADGAFDRRLDDARRQQRDTPPAPEQQAAAETKAAAPGKAGGAPAAEKDDAAPDGEAKQGDGDAGVLAAAVLALLGQSVPAARAVAAAPAAAGASQGHGAAATGVLPGGLPDAAGVTPQPPLPGLPGTPGKPEGLMNAAVQPERLALPGHEPGDMQALPVASLPAAVAHAAPPAAHVLGMASAAGTPAFAQELGQQVAWLGGQDLKQARIRLHPEELGQLDVKVSVTHGQVDVTFAVQHPAAVHAVQQTLAQLDTLLAQHGLSLGHAEVGQQQARGEQSQGQAGGGRAAGGDDDMGLAAPVSLAPAALGLLDTFA